LTLAATAEGLGTCWIGAFDEGAVKRLLGVPDGVKVVALTPLGYPASADLVRPVSEQKRRPAAEVFGKLAVEYRGHAKAAQAATFAYQLWGQVAERSRASADYLQLAATLRNLLESFGDHPQRAEALWLLPVALQLAGRFDEAAGEFAKVAETSPHWEEAQYAFFEANRAVARAGTYARRIARGPDAPDAPTFRTRLQRPRRILDSG
jgi:tetratricopeptide (TPR) repeat protein